MKTNRFATLFVFVFAVVVLAHAAATPSAPAGFCANAPSWLIGAANAVLTFLGYPSICGG
jgi:hypothetical protein